MRSLVEAVLERQQQEREALIARPVEEIAELPENWSRPFRARGAARTGPPCVTCTQPTTKKEGLECSACASYRRRHGRARPTGPMARRSMEQQRDAERSAWRQRSEA